MDNTYPESKTINICIIHGCLILSEHFKSFCSIYKTTYEHNYYYYNCFNFSKIS